MPGAIADKFAALFLDTFSKNLSYIYLALLSLFIDRRDFHTVRKTSKILQPAISEDRVSCHLELKEVRTMREE